MRDETLAGQLLGVLRQQGGIMRAVLPGLALTMLHSTALDLPRADVIDALDSDHYRIQWIIGSYVLGNAVATSVITKWEGMLQPMRDPDADVDIAPTHTPEGGRKGLHLDPEANDYLYFVANGSGGHAFARTLGEHNRNVARWRAIERSRATTAPAAGAP